MAHLARTAYANARTHALRGSVLSPAVADLVREGAAIPHRLAALRAEGIAAADGRELERVLVLRLADVAGTLSRSYPVGGGLLRAVVELRELENLKLAARALRKRIAATSWSRLWLPLGSMATLDFEEVAAAASPALLAGALRRTPYAELSPLVARAADAALEMGIDRWGTLRVANQAGALPGTERDARDLALLFARERDLQCLSRARSSYRVPWEIAAGALAVLPREIRVDRLRKLYEDGPLPGGWDAALLAVRHARGAACARAFRGNPLRLAPGLALVLLLDSQVAAAGALVQGGADESAAAAVQRATAPSALRRR